MRDWRQFGLALLFALASAGLVIGGLSLSLAENYTASRTASAEAPLIALQPSTVTASMTPVIFTSSARAASPTTPVAGACPIPAGWVQAIVQTGDTLASFAARNRTDAATLRSGNCLHSDSVVPNSVIYVPPAAPNTAVACLAGLVGWSKSYVVVPGDTLYRIATNHYTTVDRVKQVNCRTSDLIHVGEVLWVPIVATRTPGVTLIPDFNTLTPHPTDPLTETALPFTETPLPFTASPSP